MHSVHFTSSEKFLFRCCIPFKYVCRNQRFSIFINMAKLHHMNPMATSKHWSDLRTDDDIQSAVSTFLEDESHNLNGKTLHESIVEVSRWLGTQIQKEREGWAYKIRMAMQEIENHRRETLKINNVIQECTNQLRLIAECCNMDGDILVKISQEDTKRALPLYIECLAELINTLVDDRLQCLQLLKLSEADIDGQTVFSMLTLHLQKLEFQNSQSKKEQEDHMVKVECENTQLLAELNRHKKQVNKLQEDHKKLQLILQAVQVEDQQEAAQTAVQDRTTSPTMNAAAKSDANGIQITEEKLLKLQSSAKRLESSLQDALSQIDHFHKNVKTSSKQTVTSKQSKNPNYKLKPLMRARSPTRELPNLKNLPPTKLAYTQSSLSERRANSLQNSFVEKTNSQQNSFMEKTNRSLSDRMSRFQVSETSGISDSKSLDLNDPPVRIKWRRRAVSPLSLGAERAATMKERAMPKMQAQQQSSKSFTFRSLVRSLDEMRAKKATKTKGGQKVSKCLRCQKLFTLNDNHKKACCYHPRSKERVEEYTSKGRLTRVSYVWQCCRQSVDSQGCLYGQHV
ncbi:uncharacterized protein LOC132546224 [Ylistrum balloti]|uniref:uncharacterized protein LOC132546224 n=1 Tax=Ylistrum balloti TaxID=509963 RepID=UPI002905E8B8|nr:uncharacterized protein LOC132546224 [Ylistrum balloti]